MLTICHPRFRSNERRKGGEGTKGGDRDTFTGEEKRKKDPCRWSGKRGGPRGWFLLCRREDPWSRLPCLFTNTLCVQESSKGFIGSHEERLRKGCSSLPRQNLPTSDTHTRDVTRNNTFPDLFPSFSKPRGVVGGGRGGWSVTTSLDPGRTEEEGETEKGLFTPRVS